MHYQPASAGYRLYAVFQTAKQDVLGIWTNVESQHCLNLGDQVLLERNHSGRLRLALTPLPYSVQLSIFRFLNRTILRSHSTHSSPSSSNAQAEPTALPQDIRPQDIR